MLSFLWSVMVVLPLFQLDLLAAMGQGVFAHNPPDYETVWDLTNRVCDRWLPQHKVRD